jgi:signal transduction histidine kinase
VTPVVQAAAARLGALLGEAVSVESRFETVDARVAVDASTVHQIIRNLALNARAAMPDGGRLVLELTETVIDGRAMVLLRVTDDGAGMDGEVLAHVGEPHFSTKGQDGHGLGLSLLKERLASFGGSLRFTSAPGEGTSVEVLLPREG